MVKRSRYSTIFLLVCLILFPLGCGVEDSIKSSLNDQVSDTAIKKTYNGFPFEAIRALEQVRKDSRSYLIEFMFPPEYLGTDISIELNGIIISPTYGGIRFFDQSHFGTWNSYQSVSSQTISGKIRIQEDNYIPFTTDGADYTPERFVFVRLIIGPDKNNDSRGDLLLYVGPKLFLGLEPPKNAKVFYEEAEHLKR